MVAAALVAAPLFASAEGLRPEPPDRGSYGESWTFIADLDGGAYLQLSLGLTNLGPGGVKGLCRVVLVEPGRAALAAGTRTGSNGWRGEPARLSVGPCSAEAGGGGTVVEAALPEATVRLAFEPAPPPAASPAGEAKVGQDHYRTEVLLYRSRVRARVQLPGEAPRELAGAGFADHTRSTVPPRALARRWVRFRSLRGERPLLVLVREALDGSLGPAQACAGDGCQPVIGLALGQPAAPGGPPPRVRLAAADPARSLELRAGALLYRDAPVEALGLLRYLAALFYGSPVTWVHRATASDGNGAPVEGILEVEVAGD